MKGGGFGEREEYVLFNLAKEERIPLWEVGWADWDRTGAIDWFDHVMQRLAPFDVTLTLCFTPVRAGRTPHHTSPPINLIDFANFCETVVRRYAGPRNPARHLHTSDDLDAVVKLTEDFSQPSTTAAQ